MTGPGAETERDRPLWASLTRAPELARPDLAAVRLAEWTAETADHPDLRRMAAVPTVSALLASVADHSPYLWRLIRADPGRCARLLGQAPGPSLEGALATMARLCAGCATANEALAPLRRAKADVALLVALADLGGVWSLDEVTHALTSFADRAVGAALDVLLRDAARAGKLRTEDGSRPAAGCGLVVLALGKGGGGELNYSSDLDLVVLYDPAAPALVPGAAPAPVYVRLVQSLVRLLSERTSDGYVFRVDLRLRPDPASTAIALSVPAAFAYYETLGQNWERAAFIKARPIAGDLRVGAGFLAELAPFIWRKYFDYAAIADIHAMKRQIHAVRGHASVTVAGHDVKLGRGGIREIEFFVQTQQLIFGGRRPDLRGPRTLDMLLALNRDGWISAEAAADLTAAYRYLRTVEHRLQMIDDEQTQRLPTDPDALSRFARFAGHADRAAFEAELLGHLRAVEMHYARLFEHEPDLAIEAGSLVFAGESIDAETVATLGRLGFVRPAEAVEIVRGWHFGRRPAVRGARAREVLTQLVPALLTALSGSGDPDAALSAFDAALARMPAATELFAILTSNRAVRELFADILGLAPRLVAAVASRPHLLDAAIDPASTPADVPARVAAVLDAQTSTEAFLDASRDIAREESFLIGVRLLSGDIGSARAGEQFSALAEALVGAALARVSRDFAAEHGVVPGAGRVVLAMGKLGSREMTATSDLDLMLIYDAGSVLADSDGARPLDATRYFARLTQRLIAALTVTTRRGRLYEVDMRLRPSGRQGPLATRFSAFERYQVEEAALWEKMALTRARVIAGDPSLAVRVETAIRRSLALPRPDGIGPEIAALRALVAREKGEDRPWDLKLASGGLLDIEFLAQFLALRHAAHHPEILLGATAPILERAIELGLVAQDQGRALVDSFRLFIDVTQLVRLTVEGPFDPAKAGEGLKRRLAALANVPDFTTLDRDLRDRRREVRDLFSAILA